MSSKQSFNRIGVVGAGAMGRGIAQLFAQCGCEVRLHDSQPEATAAALHEIGKTFARLAEKGKLSSEQAQAAQARISAATELGALADCELVIEAIVERLDAKRALFQNLEGIVGPDAVLATNTSSLSVTAIAAACSRPQRVAGIHFFNPVPLMKVVEVVRGARSDERVVARLIELVRAAGHRPVVAADTPGFLVNHAGRGYGTEALKALGEGVADVVTIDRILREQVRFGGNGFRLGPFELLDLTALDVSHPVMESIYRQFYDEPRFRPSVITAQRLAGGLLGRKSAEGFYRYVDGKQEVPEEAPVPAAGALPPVWLPPGGREAALAATAAGLGATVETGDRASARALILLAPLGLDATAAAAGFDATRAVAVDTLFDHAPGSCQRRVLMPTPATRPEFVDAARALFAADGATVSVLRDSPGFVAQRVVAMVVSIGCEIAQQRIAEPADIDAAVRGGLGYPAGPLEMGDALGPATILAILEGMHAVTADPRYRPAQWLRRRALLGLPLHHAD